MGASVRGPQHRRDGQPNQDAWLTRRTRAFALAVVGDGLGSRPHSAIGSRAACRSVADAARLWSATPAASPDLLLRLIHAIWNIRVQAHGRNESATTCAFAIAVADGRLLLGQLGDGLVVARSGAGVIVLEPPEDRFGNTTTGLGIAADLREWRTHLEPQATGPVAVLITSDGIADDLLPEKRLAFLNMLTTRYGTRPPNVRSRDIAQALREWPTPGHCDDKTLALLWRSDTPERI